MEKHLINQEILSYVLSKNRKYNQIVWIPLPEYLKVLSMSEELKIAPNQLIAAIIVAFFKNQQLFIKEVPVEKQVERKIIVTVCPVCLKEFDSLVNLKQHVITYHKLPENDINKMLTGMVEKFL